MLLESVHGRTIPFPDASFDGELHSLARLRADVRPSPNGL